MKQRPVLRDRIGVLDNERAGGERAEQIGFVERMTGNNARAGGRRPNARQMGFARAFGTDQGDGTRRPIRPGLDQRQRAGIARSGQKILARVAFGMIECERELAWRK